MIDFARVGRSLGICEPQEHSPVPPGTVRGTFGMHIQTPRAAVSGASQVHGFFAKAVDSEKQLRAPRLTTRTGPWEG